MYSDIKSVQILIALLKEYNIKHLVLSAGTRHTPFVRSVEKDEFFTCYSVVDERSAGFFAIGLIKELNAPVAVCCTSGTAACNYTSPMAEAFYAKLPLIAITTDRNSYYLYQQEEQMVPQREMFKDICKKEVTLPFVKDDKDFWYCNRLINEALMDIEYSGDGPVHINVPIEEGLFDFNTTHLPKVTRINKITLLDTEKWKTKAEELCGKKKILITYGQANPISYKQEEIIEQFAKKFGAVIMVDHLSNLKCYGTIHAYNVTRYLYAELMAELVPDVVIAVNGAAVEIHGWLKNCNKQYEFWNVIENGDVSDPFRNLTNMFCCSPVDFFETMLKYCGGECNDKDYYEKWKTKLDKIVMPEFSYSDVYVVQKFLEMLPENSLLSLGNSNSVRFVQHFPIDKSISVYCNRGTCGIDGSVSAFVGQAYAHKELSFLLLGDLSFFYDMNGLWNRYITNNMRILINNNSCGEIFYMNPLQDRDNVGRHTAADNKADAKGWVESRGFLYLRAENLEEFEENIKIFLAEKSKKPICFEVITDKYKNLEEINKINKANEVVTPSKIIKNTIKSIIKR